MGALDTHAYAVSSEVRDWMIAQLPDETTVWPWIARERAIDRWMRREIGRRFRVLICRPQFAVQADDVSDITERRDGAYGSADVINLAAAHRPASELRRGLEIMTDGLHAELKRVTGF